LWTVFTIPLPCACALATGTRPTAAEALEDLLEFSLVETAILVGIAALKQRAQPAG
jgi:hypothetical protein